MPAVTPLEFALLNDFQRRFPLSERPYAAVAQELGTSERWVMSTLRRMMARGSVSRVGPVFAPHSVGCSTLAALAVPPERLSEVALRVSRWPQVNHNYAREHRLNLWFVVTARDELELGRVLAAIESQADCGAVVALPLLEEFRIDLGFDLRKGARPTSHSPAPRRQTLTVQDRLLVTALEDGLPLIERPFCSVAARAHMREGQVLARIGDWLSDGVIRRFGVVVRHHELGYAANAMAVWNVPDDQVRDCGQTLAAQHGVTLCYRRRRAEPQWPYNLFCMVHGRDRATVEAQIADIAHATGLAAFDHALLFSTTRFKQRGARYGFSPGRVPVAA